MEINTETIQALAKEIFDKAPSLQSFGFSTTYLNYEINGLTTPGLIFSQDPPDSLKGWLVENNINHQDVLLLIAYLREFPFITYHVDRKKGITINHQLICK